MLRSLVAACLVLWFVPTVLSQGGNETAGPDSPDSSTVDAGRFLLTLASVIGLGFAGFLLFDRFRIADTLLLIGFGIFLSYVGALDPALLRTFQPLVATFAILIIILDAGLDLRFGDLELPKMGWGIAFSTIGFFLTIGLVGAIGHYVIGFSWILATILACAVADTAGMVILPLLSHLRVPSQVRTALLVETSLPDIYAITLVLALVNVAGPGAPTGGFDAAASGLAAAVATTLLLGIVSGLLWIRALGWLATQRYAYMTTLAMVLGLNWATGAAGGAGPMAVLLFGLVIGNRDRLGKLGDVGHPKVFRDMAQFNGEVSFLVRSFFFVYLGAILDLDGLTVGFVAAAFLIVAAILVARAGAVYTMTLRPGPVGRYRNLLMTAIPRGTTAAVIATLPAIRGIEGSDALAQYGVLVILLTNLIFTVGLFTFFRGGAKAAKAQDA